MRGCAPFWTLALLATAIGWNDLHAAPPELEAWHLNTTGITGFNGLPANVQRIRFSSANAYVDASGVPAYTIGPWPGNPNTVTNQAAVFRIPRAPVANAGARTATPLGAIGVWVNGVAIYNALDARSYNNLDIWHQNAVVVEAGGFDACLGHPPMSGQYHHHQHPVCLDPGGASAHSGILGYAFDGFPVYGPYGFGNPDGTGGVARMRSGYRLRAITTRTTLPDGTVLSPPQYGPAVSATYPLGYYREDFEFVAGLGDLDAFNGRVAVTPEYPAGTYAYFTTVDATGASAYPYVLGPQYYGVVATDNLTTHGHVTIGEAVTDYTPTWLGVGGAPRPVFALAQNVPNPARAAATIDFTTPAAAHVTLRVFDLAGREVAAPFDGALPAGPHRVRADVSQLPAGTYFYRLRVGNRALERKLLLVR